MGQRIRAVALAVAALAAVSILGACTAAQPTKGAPTAAPTATPARGGVELALKTITWPQGEVVARVNGIDIRMSAWREEVMRQLRLITRQYEVDWHDAANLEHVPVVMDGIMERMVQMELLRQLAAREGFTVSQTELQNELEEATQQILLSGEHKDLEAFLQANEMTRERFDDLIHDQVLIDKLVAAHSGPTEAEQVRARHILVETEQKAQEVLAKLAAQVAFETVATDYSVDSGTKLRGGDLGWFPRGVMVPEFEQAAFALQTGQTSGVVKSEHGYHIIRVDERGVRPLEEPLLTALRERSFTEWLNQQLAQANIQWFHTTRRTPAPR